MDRSFTGSVQQPPMVVVEFGSAYIRAGIGKDPCAHLQWRPSIGRAAWHSVLFGPLPGADVAQAVGIELRRVFLDELLKSPTSQGLLVLVPMFSCEPFRRAIHEEAERLEVSQLHLVCTELASVACCVPLLDKTVLVIDVGYSGMRVVPVVHGTALLQAAKDSPVGLQRVHARLAQYVVGNTHAETDECCGGPFPHRIGGTRVCAESIAHRYLRVAPSRAQPTMDGKAEETWLLWEGHSAVVSDEAARSFGELFWDGDEADEAEGLAELVRSVVQCSPIDARRDLLGNVLMVGAGSELQGMHARLAMELQPWHIQFVKLPIRPSMAAWFGASVLSTLESLTGTIQLDSANLRKLNTLLV